MSIEDRLESLENALVALTEVLKASTSGTAVTSATAKKDDGEKKPATTRSRAPKADKAPTLKAFTDFATKFLDDVENDEKEYAERRGEIKRLSKKYDVERLSTVEEGLRQEVMDALTKFADEGEKPGNEDDDKGI